MKKKLLCITAAFLSVVLLFSGCIIIPIKQEKPHGDADKVSRILIYDLDELDEGIYYPNLPDADLPEPYELPQTEQEAFLNDLSALPFRDYIIIVIAAIDPNFNFYGTVVKLEYEDGAEEWLSSAGINLFVDADGERHSDHASVDDEVWEEFLQTYLPTP